jgi:transcription antitermination factor NusG
LAEKSEAKTEEPRPVEATMEEPRVVETTVEENKNGNSSNEEMCSEHAGPSINPTFQTNSQGDISDPANWPPGFNPWTDFLPKKDEKKSPKKKELHLKLGEMVELVNSTGFNLQHATVVDLREGEVLVRANSLSGKELWTKPELLAKICVFCEMPVPTTQFDSQGRHLECFFATPLVKIWLFFFALQWIFFFFFSLSSNFFSFFFFSRAKFFELQ